MNVSVVIPTYNRYKSLKRCIKSILAGLDLPSEIIVVDNASSDDTSNIINEFKSTYTNRGVNLVYFVEERQGANFARNSGIEISKGEIVAFIDDDCVASKNWISDLLRLHKKFPDVVCFAGNYYSYFRNNIFAVALDISSKIGITVNGLYEPFLLSKNYCNSFLKREHYLMYYTSQNMSIKKALIGNIKFRMILDKSYNEDIDFCIQIITKNKHGIRYTSKAVIYHSSDNNLLSNLKRELLWGYYGSHIKFVPFAFRKRPFARILLYYKVLLLEQKKYSTRNLVLVTLFLLGILFRTLFKFGFIYGSIKRYLFSEECFEYDAYN